jgi:hypothetical protein
LIVHSSSIKELLETSILKGKPERQESRKNGAFKIFHTFNTCGCGPTPFLFPLSCMLHKTLLSLVSYNLLLKTSGSPCLQYRNLSLSSLLYKNLTSKLLLFALSSLEFTLESVAEAMIMRDSLMYQKLRHLSLL